MTTLLNLPVKSITHVASGAPQSSTGANGDFFLDTSSNGLYVKVSEVWQPVPGTWASIFNSNLGFYGADPVTQPASSGPQTAGGSYGAVEQTMLQEVYNAMRALGLMS